jgi:amino acid transporter
MLNNVPNFKRSMNAFETLLITLSEVTPCCSFFVLAPTIIQMAGSGALLSFLGASLIAVCVAWVYAELGSAFPFTGLEYAIIGRVLGPLAGFVILGLTVLTLPLAIASMSLSIAKYLQPVLPSVTPIQAGLVTIAITTLFGLLNVRINSVIMGGFLAIEIGAILVLTWLGFAHPTPGAAHLLLHPQRVGTGGVLQSTPIAAIVFSMPLALNALNGYNSAVSFGEETANARSSMGRIVMWALLLAVVTEVAPLVGLLAGGHDVKALSGSENMLMDFIQARGGRALAVGLGLAVALAQLNANIAAILVFGRQMFSSGRDQSWSPGVNYFLTRISGRFNAPWTATLMCGVLSAAGCFISFNALLIISSSAFVVIYVAVCLAALVGRRNGSTAHGHYRMPFFPFAPIAGLAGLGYTLFTIYQDKETGRPSLYATAAMILASVGYYYFVLRRRGAWVLTGPREQAEDVLPAQQPG